MKKLQMITIAVSLAMCLTAITATGAAAAVKKAEIVNKAGKPLVKNKYTLTGGETVIETTGEFNVKCKKFTGSGEVKGTTSATQTETFTECKNNSGSTCKTAGGKEEEIVVGPGEKLWHTEPGGERLVLVYDPPTVVIVCNASLKVEVKGSFVVRTGVEQEEKLKTTYSFTAVSKGGVQEPMEYENRSKEIIKGITLELKVGSGAFQQAAVAGTQTIVFEEEAKLV